VKAIELATDYSSALNSDSSMNLVGYEAVKNCAMKAYKQAGIDYDKAGEVLDVVELHDCFSTNELVTYEALGLCREG